MTEMPHIEGDQRQHVAELLRGIDVSAPESLHKRVQAMAASPRGRFAPPLPRHRSRKRLSLVGAGAAAVVAIAIAVGTQGGGGTRAVTFSEAAASTLRPATLPAPPQSPAHPEQLGIAVGGIPFPDWSGRLGWRSTGSRTDRVDGRRITTVFYADSGGRRIGYAILAGAPAPRAGGGVISWRGGVAYRLLTEDDAATVTWLRDGRLCVISGHDVSGATLLRLASWSQQDGGVA